MNYQEIYKKVKLIVSEAKEESKQYHKNGAIEYGFVTGTLTAVLVQAYEKIEAQKTTTEKSMIKVTQQEIDNLMNEALEIIDAEGSKFPGMSYEQGIIAALEWAEGDAEAPLNE